MTIDEIRSRSLSLTRDIRDAEKRGDAKEVMKLLGLKQPLAALLYSYDMAREAARVKTR